MKATLAQLTQIPIFSALDTAALDSLQTHTHLQRYKQKDIILHEGAPLPVKLHILLDGALQVKKKSITGKETVLRSLTSGDIFAVSALFEQQRSATTILAIEDCQVLTIPKAALLETIQQAPELALQILVKLNQRLQQQHSTIHGLVSERAIVRLAQLIHYTASQQGTESMATGEQLRGKLPYAQIASSIGVTYEECSRLMKELTTIVKYSRGGKIIILNGDRLAAIASGESDLE